MRRIFLLGLALHLTWAVGKVAAQGGGSSLGGGSGSGLGGSGLSGSSLGGSGLGGGGSGLVRHRLAPCALGRSVVSVFSHGSASAVNKKDAVCFFCF